MTVTAVNDAPTVTVPSVAYEASEQTPLDLTGTIVVGDVDAGSSDLTVSLSVPTGADTGTLSAGAGGTVVLITGSGSDTLTLQGTLSSVNAVLAGSGGATLTYTADSDTPTDTTLTVTIDDGGATGAMEGGVTSLTSSDTVGITVTSQNDPPTIVVGSTEATGSVTELADGASGESTAELAATGTITFADIDDDGAHTAQVGVSVVDGAGETVASPFGALTLGAVDQAANTVGWTFAVSDGAIDDLAEGETRTQVYTVTITDGSSGSVDQTVTITITGSNDAPTIDVGTTTATGAATERPDGAADENDGTLIDAGTIGYADVDTTDTHVATVTATVGNGSGGTVASPLGALTLDAIEQGADTVAWTFTVDAADLDTLQESEVRTQVYTVTIDDGATADPIATQTVTITLTGSNDAPILTLDDASGTIAEADAGATLRTTGTLSVADVDAGDGVASVTASSNGDATWSGGTLPPALTAALEADLTIDGDLAGWTFETTEDLDFLAASESITLSFDLVATDDSGAANAASNAPTATITIAGSNDAPTLTRESGDDSTADLTDTDAELTATGSLTVGDLDLADVVDASVASVATTGTLPGALDDTALLAMMGAASDLGAGTTTGTLTWTFDSEAEAFDGLAEGQRISLTYGLRATDGAGSFASFPVTIWIAGTNDAAVITPQGTPDTSVTEAGGTANGTPGDVTASGAFTSSDADGTDDAFQAVTTDAASANGYGGYTVDAAGAWTYTLDDANRTVDALAAGDTLTDSFVVRSEDGTEATVAVTITGANDAPTAGTIADQASVDGAAANLDVAPFFGDVDMGDTHSYAVTAGTLPNGLTLSDTGLIDGTIASGASAGSPYSIDVTATDAGGLTVTTSFQWTVTNVGPTVVTPIADRSVEDGTAGFSLAVSGSFTAADGDALSFTAEGLPAWLTMTTAGTLELDGVATVPADASQQTIDGVNTTRGVFTVTVTATDADGDAVSDAFTLVFVNTVPVASDVAGATAENAAILAAETAGALLSGATDADGDALRVSIAAGATIADGSDVIVAGSDGGTFTVRSDGTYAFDPGTDFDALRTNEQAPTSLPFTLTDDEGGADAASLTITVTGTNDAPTLAIQPTVIDEAADASAQALSDTVPFAVTDADVGDTATPSVDLASATITWSGGALDADAETALAPLAADGVVTFDPTEATTTGGDFAFAASYAPSAVDLDFLAAGETLTISIPAAVSDGTSADDATATLIFVVRGANDAPDAASADPTGAVSEDGAVIDGGLSATGTIDLTDLDLTDAHTAAASFVDTSAAGGAAFGTLDATVTDGRDRRRDWRRHLDVRRGER
ncbi:MAG: VCBS domain-containing protein [Trueperaceae bacterium]|nr:VCBS domain-containing protein [Trueperaceae bacterium]